MLVSSSKSRRGVVVAALVLLGLLACEEPVLGPSLPPTPPGPIVEPPDEDPFDPGVVFSWDTRGILVFPGTQADEGQIRALDARLRGAGWRTPTYHVCSETAEWEATVWADGEPPFSTTNITNLERFLKVTAKLGSQVLLDVFCTVRDNHSWMGRRGEEYAQTVARIASPYDHVAIHIANEAWHPASWFREAINGEAKLRRMRDAIRSSGFRGQIGTDDNAGRPGDTRYNPTYRALGFWPDFHPWRTEASHLPNRADFVQMIERNPGQVVISEPVAYSTWRRGGCCTDNREAIRRYMSQAEAEGIVWFFHSTDGLQWPQIVSHFDWVP